MSRLGLFLVMITLVAQTGRASEAASSANRETVVLLHGIGLRKWAMWRLESNLRREGYRVLNLGADVPPAALAVAVERHKPDVIAMSATMPGGGDRMVIAADEVQERVPEARFVVGGRALTSRLQIRPGMEACHRVTEVVETVDAVLKRAELN